jgi:hypothetical protein
MHQGKSVCPCSLSSIFPQCSLLLLEVILSASLNRMMMTESGFLAIQAVIHLIRPHHAALMLILSNSKEPAWSGVVLTSSDTRDQCIHWLDKPVRFGG